MSDRKQKASTIFSVGLALSAGPAFIIDSYAFAKNQPMDALLFYILQLIAVCLIGVALTYFAYRRLYILFEPPVVYLVLTQLTITGGIGTLLLNLFIAFQVSYGYYLLPVAIDLAGALVLMALVRLGNIR